MAIVLLTSPSFIRNISNISNNITDKTIKPAIEEAQRFRLRPIVGETIYNKLIAEVADGSIETDTVYKNLLDAAQYVIAYYAIASIVLFNYSKTDNIGNVTVTDDNTASIGFSDTVSLSKLYEKKADAYAKDLQKYIIDNNLIGGDCQNLSSSASTSIWLGGYRGRKII